MENGFSKSFAFKKTQKLKQANKQTSRLSFLFIYFSILFIAFCLEKTTQLLLLSISSTQLYSRIAFIFWSYFCSQFFSFSTYTILFFLNTLLSPFLCLNDDYYFYFYSYLTPFVFFYSPLSLPFSSLSFLWTRVPGEKMWAKTDWLITAAVVWRGRGAVDPGCNYTLSWTRFDPPPFNSVNGHFLTPLYRIFCGSQI